MDPATLVTFILDCKPGTLSVDLYGSWDNFQQPYPLTKDKQVGHGRWQCCPQFNNIICDGEPGQRIEPRNGALVTGGTYWFYFKVNDDLESPNPYMATTSNCPLLPGQTVNVLDIPQLTQEEATKDRNSRSLQMSLDPADRESSFGAPQKRRRIELANMLPETWGARRDEYIKKSLGRVQTAAANVHILTYFGHSPPQRTRDSRSRRPKSAPPIPDAVAHDVVKEDIGSKPRQGFVEDMTDQRATTGSEGSGLSRLYQSHNRLFRQFVNPFQRRPQRLEIPRPGASLRRDHDLMSPAFINRPTTAHNGKRRLSHVGSPDRCNTAPAALYSGVPESIHCSKPPNRSDYLCNLRMACANLIDSASDGKDRAYTDEVARSGTLHRPPSLRRASSQVWTPESNSPFPGSDSFWGTPLRHSMFNQLHSPVTDYDYELDQRRSGQLYSQGGSWDGLGLMLGEMSIGSQETIKPGVSEGDVAGSNLNESGPRIEPASDLAFRLEAEMTEDKAIGDFGYLSAAIS